MKPLPHFSNSEIEALRPDSLRPSPSEHPHATSWEQEATSATGGDLADVLTVMLLGSECQFRCLMCDLWKTTHRGPTPSGSIPKQLHNALRGTNGNPAGVTKPRERWIKLYNASNFFAPYNVPVNDLDLIAREVVAFQRIVVENHPRLLRESIVRFRDALHGRLEVALGLETVHHVHADDVAQAFMQAISHRSVAVGESFHVVSPAALTLRGYAEAMAAWFGQPANLRYLPWEEWKSTVSAEEATATWDHIAHSPCCSIAKAERLLEYRPRYRSLQAVMEAVEWLIAEGVVEM